MPQKQIFDLVVVGAGPAGCSAALTAARRGARALLLEKDNFPRQKVCGEFVSYESLDLLRRLLTGTTSESLLDHGTKLTRARTFIDGMVIETAIRPAAYSIPRYEMDLAMWTAAIELGVQARPLTTVHQINRNGLFAVETADHEEFNAPAVVNATGRWSNLNSAVKVPLGKQGKWLGIKAHFAENNPAPSMDLHFFEGGYCGISPVDVNRINVCAMVRADVAAKLEGVFRLEARLFERCQGWRQLTTPVSTSPLLFRIPNPIEADMLLAGDAAAFIDPFAGDGISIALQTGEMAAAAVLNAFRRGLGVEAAAQQYRSEYSRRILPALSNAARVRRLMFVPSWLRRPVLKTMCLTGFSETVLKLTRAKTTVQATGPPALPLRCHGPEKT